MVCVGTEVFVMIRTVAKMPMLKLIVWLCCAVQVAAVDARTTTNSKIRHSMVDAVVLHSIGGPYCKRDKVEYSRAPGDALRWRSFFERHKVLGIHYVVDRQGRVLSSVAENRIANHALGWNERSIGIELVNDGDGQDLFPQAQWLAVQKLVNGIIARHPKINANRVFRHSDIDHRIFVCGRAKIKQKQDPGKGFDYPKFVSSLD